METLNIEHFLRKCHCQPSKTICFCGNHNIFYWCGKLIKDPSNKQCVWHSLLFFSPSLPRSPFSHFSRHGTNFIVVAFENIFHILHCKIADHYGSNAQSSVIVCLNFTVEIKINKKINKKKTPSVSFAVWKTKWNKWKRCEASNFPILWFFFLWLSSYFYHWFICVCGAFISLTFTLCVLMVLLFPSLLFVLFLFFFLLFILCDCTMSCTGHNFHTLPSSYEPISCVWQVPNHCVFFAASFFSPIGIFLVSFLFFSRGFLSIHFAFEF